MSSFDLGERIKQVRMVEDMIEKKQEELDATLEQHHKFVETGRAEILAFLNTTNQKSANTEFGGCHWKPKITYRVEDKDAFQSACDWSRGVGIDHMGVGSRKL